MFDIDKSIKKIIGNKKFGGKNDIDGDGVINKKDCQPRNTMRQDKVSIFKVKDKRFMNNPWSFRSWKPGTFVVETVERGQLEGFTNYNDAINFAKKVAKNTNSKLDTKIY